MRYQLVLTANSYQELVTINESEALIHRGFESEFSYASKEGSLKRSEIPLHTKLYTKYFGSIAYARALRFLPADAAPELHALAQAVKSIGAFSFSPSHIRALSPISSMPILGYKGEGLARVLLHVFLEEREKFAEIEGALKAWSSIRRHP